MDRKVEGAQPRGRRRASPGGATLSALSAELAEADGVSSTGTKAGLFWEEMKRMDCGNWVG